MALSDDDVREILRLIDESELDELKIEMPGLHLHVRRGGGGAPPAPVVAAPSANGAITAPMLGTFYRASAPGEAPFVEVGDEVQADTVVCLIEVMKMMNAIPAGVTGRIVEVCAENAQLVEFGAPLFRVA
jgi:acetyl-CoA carboxylase biotin carboxyl carrier protein